MGLLPDVGELPSCQAVVTECKQPLPSYWAKVLDLLGCDVILTYCFVWLKGRVPASSSSKVNGLVKPGSLLYFLRFSLIFVWTLLPFLPFKSNWCATWFAVTLGWQGAAFGSPRSFPMVDHAFLLFLDMSVDSIRECQVFWRSLEICSMTFSPLVDVSLEKGSASNMVTYSRYTLVISSERPGMYSTLQPRGMCRRALFWTMSAKVP